MRTKEIIKILQKGGNVSVKADMCAMFEQLFFIIFSIILFVIIFFKMIKKNDTSYVIILGIQALGIAIDFIALVSYSKISIFIKLITYFMSIVLPLFIILLETKNINVMRNSKTFLVDIYITLGNNKKAKELLNILIEKDEKCYDYHKKLAKIYEKEGGMRKAIEEYVQCIDLNKQDYDSYYKVATLLNELDRKPEAIQMLNNLISKKPEHYEASMILGELLIEAESYKEAAMVYLDALKYNPLSFDLNYNLGIVYTMLNDFNNAKQCYEKAANINHLAYNAKYSLAEIALIFKDLDKAEQLFQQALGNDELSADCYFELAKINLMRGSKDIAIKYINIAIDISSKKIVEKVEKEPLFMTIRNKISIPFNLEEKEDTPSLTKNEKLAKNRLENTTDITTNMGYGKVETSSIEKDEIQIEEKQK